MAQFDFILIFPILLSMLIALFFNYLFLIKILLPSFSGVFKLRKKILKKFKLNVLQIKKIAIY